MKQILLIIVFVFICFCLSIMGCTTIEGSRGILNEDVANLMTDVETGFSSLTDNLKEKTFIIKDHQH